MNHFPHLSEGILGEQDTAKTNTELFLSLVGQYFPEAIKDGEIDFNALKEEMGEFEEVGSEHYDFTWAGKQSAKKEALSDLYGKTLHYQPQESVNPDTTENIYIEGDNLEALKLLRRNYHGKIKMIYIDPPYNTGNDFVYHDDFSMTEDELGELSGDIVDGVRYRKNPKDSSKYHTDWLNMMYPRLKIARELLSDDGVIFISIDDNEVENLYKICNEIFGECNFIADFIWNSRKSVSNDAVVSLSHNYTLTYTKNITAFNGIKKTFKLKDTGEGFENPDNDPRGKWKADPFDSPGIRPNLTYPIKNPNTGEIFMPPNGRCWRTGEKEYLQFLADNRIIFGKTGKGKPQLKRFYTEAEAKGLTPKSLWDDCGTSTDGTDEIMGLFTTKVFDTPKPTSLIRKMLELVAFNDSIVLDFFSGSATTAHAVFAHNFHQVFEGKKGNVKFILVQLPEPCDEKSEAYKAGYTNICEIGKERIRKAGIHEYRDIRGFAGNSLRWNDERKAELGENYICPEDVDIGFKVFTIGGTTIRWNTMDDETLKELSDDDYSKGDRDNLDFMPNSSDLDIVYEIMLRQYGIPLSTPIEKMPEISGRTYSFADAIVVCLEPEIDDTLIERLASIEPIPAKFILRDSAFGDDIELKDVSYRKLSALIRNHQTEEERRSKYNNYTVEFI